MALADSLRDSFTGTGDPGRTSPDDAHATMGLSFTQSSGSDPPRNTDLPAPAVIDTGALGRLVSRFTNIDMSGIDRAVAGSGVSANVNALDATSLLAPIAPALRLIESVQNGDAMRLLQQLRAPTGGPAVGLSGVSDALGQLLGPTQLGTITDFVGSLRGILPIPLETEGVITQGGELALTARDVIALLGGLMAVHTAALEMRDTSTLIDGLLAPETVDQLIRRARVGLDSDVLAAAVSTVTDPDDPAQVDGAIATVVELTAPLDELIRVLTRAMGFGEATLIHADPQRAANSIDVAAAQIRSIDPSRVRRTSELLANFLGRALPADGAAPTLDFDGAWNLATALSAQIVTAIQGISAAPLTDPVARSIGAVTSALHAVNQVFAEISGAIRGAFAVVRGAVEAIDLQGVAREITRFLQPLNEAIDALTEFIETIKGAIGAVAQKIVDAITAITTVLTTGAGHVQAAFDAIHSVFESLNIQGLLDDARAGVQQVADELHRVQLQPYFDKAIEVMDVSADVISALPFELLPDSAKRELDKVVQPIQSIHFKQDVVDVLTTQLNEILSRVETDVLDEIDKAFQDVVIALGEFDPRNIIDPLDEQFDAFMGRLQAVNPEELLAPVIDAIDQIRAQIASLDLRARILDPLDEGFERIVSVLDEINPAQLLVPLEEQVGQLRQRILDVTHLDQWADRVTEAHQAFDAFLTRFDPTGLGPRLDALLDAALAVPRPPGRSVVGSIIAALVERTGVHARAESFVAVLGWMSGEDGAAEVRTLVGDASAALARSVSTVRGAQLTQIGAQLDPGFRRLRAAADGHGSTTLLRQRLDPLLARVAPLDSLGALGVHQSRYLAALDASASAIRAMTARGLSEITAGSAGIAEAFAPLAEVRMRFLRITRGLGFDLTGRDLAGVLAPILVALRPSRVITLIGPIIAAIRDKIRTVLVDGLVTPVQAGITEVETLINNLDISIFRTELETLFTQVETELEALKPSTVLGPLFTDLEQLRDSLAAYDPLDPVKIVIAGMRAAIDTLATELRPSTLMGGLIATYDELLAIVAGLNVRTMLQPILDALEDLSAQLGGGLEGSATAFEHLQAAIGTLGTGGGSASIGGSVSVGGGA